MDMHEKFFISEFSIPALPKFTIAETVFLHLSDLLKYVCLL